MKTIFHFSLKLKNSSFHYFYLLLCEPKNQRILNNSMSSKCSIQTCWLYLYKLKWVCNLFGWFIFVFFVIRFLATQWFLDDFHFLVFSGARVFFTSNNLVHMLFSHLYWKKDKWFLTWLEFFFSFCVFFYIRVQNQYIIIPTKQIKSE